MLDNYSQGCFVTASLMKTLQIRGQKTSITVKNFNWGREPLNVCFTRSESLQPVGFKPRMDKLTKSIHKGRPSN